MRVLVAGVGNVLRSDDGFGVEVIERLAGIGVPDAVELMDVGIGGIHMVQVLLSEPFDLLIVVDSVAMGRTPGTVLVVRPSVEDVTALPLHARRDQLADMHFATPDRALMLASAVGALPDETWVVGCEPVDADSLGRGLSPRIAAAIDIAAAEVRSLVRARGVEWPDR